MKRFVLLSLVALPLLTQAESTGQRRFREVSERVRAIVVAPDFPSSTVSVVGVARPRKQWCEETSITVRTCGSARPKRNLYWLEIACGGRVAYVAEYDDQAPDALTLTAPEQKSACRRKSQAG